MVQSVGFEPTSSESQSNILGQLDELRDKRMEQRTGFEPVLPT